MHRTVDLGRTFRSVDQIAFAARTFVLRNPAQIQKRIVPAGNASISGARALLLSRQRRASLEALVRRIEHVELESEPDFFDLFTDKGVFSKRLLVDSMLYKG